MDDPAARALYEAVLERVRSARSLSWTSAYRFSASGQEGRCSYLIWLKKPGYGRMQAMMPDQATGAGDVVTGVIIGDGESFWIYWPAGFPGTRSWDPGHPSAPTTNLYMQRNFSPDKYSFSHESIRLGSCMVMLAFQPSLFHGQILSSLDVDAVSSIGTDEIDAESCDGILVSMADGQRMAEYWIAKGDLLPRRMRVTAHVAQDIVVEEAWTAVHLNEDIPDSLFHWTPPDHFVEYIEPDLESGLLPAGTEAPDFDAPLLTGGSFRLSEHPGRVVLLNFWRIGCPPCRKELPLLERLHRDLQRDGLVVIGCDSVDDRSRLTALLEKTGVTYPCVWDTSRAGREIRFGYEPQRSSANPLTYVIGRDGKIAAGWYGFSEQKLMDELARAGLRP